MDMSRLFIERPIATALLMAGFLLSGLLGWHLLPLAALPEIDYPTIQVTTLYPGGSAELMASAVTAPLERQLGQMPGLDHLSSSSSAGASVITLRFALSMSLDIAEQQVQAAINAASNLLPTDLPAPPVYSKVNPADAPILTVVASATDLPSSRLHELVENHLAQKMSQVPGVGLVTLAGGQRPAVRIKVDMAALARLGLSLEDVRGVVVGANVNQAKGGVDGHARAVSIDTNDQLQSAAEFGDVVLAYRNGAAVLLKDVARVMDEVENTRLAAWVNREPAVILNIQRQPGANVIETVERIKALLPHLQAGLPAAVDLRVLADRTVTIRAAAHDVLVEMLYSVVLVVLVFVVFLRSTAATLIASVAIPLSLIGSCAFMYLAGFSINNLTLMALTISTGFVVDDAIVMIENISRHLERGETPLNAALKGARQIGFTVLSLTVSLLAVLIPLLFMGQAIGRLFHDFAVTLAIAILISAVVSLTLTPMMCARLLAHRPAARMGRLHQMSSRMTARVMSAYDRSLQWVLARRGLAWSGFVATLLLAAGLYGWVGKGLLPLQDTGLIQVVTEADANVSFDAMARHQRSVVEVALKDPAVDQVASFMGVDGTNASLNTGRMVIVLKPLAARGVAVSTVMARIGQAARHLPGVQVHMQAVQDLTLDDRLAKAAYHITLTSGQRDALAASTERLLDRLRALPELSNVSSDQQTHGQEAFLQIDRDKASRLGISMAAIDAALYDAYGQRMVSTIFTQTSHYRVVLELDEHSAKDLSRLLELRLPGAGGATVPLGAMAQLTERPAALVVQRTGQLPSSIVSFDLAPGVSLSTGMDKAGKVIADLDAPANVEIAFEGAARAYEASLDNTLLLVGAAVFTMYIVLGVLYESFVHPVTILSTLPSATAGALMALVMLKLDLDVIAVIGIVLLIGIVKKNAIMMIDFALHAQRDEGLSAHDAIRQAAMNRLRPILMTTLAALLGALPLMLGSGVGSELRHPLGVTMVGGLLFSQFLTLYSTPVIYLGFERLSRAWESRRSRREVIAVVQSDTVR